MLNKIRDAIANDNELSSESLRFLSLIALAISGSMSLFKYTQERKFLWDLELGFKPSLISALIALMLLSPLYMRKILKWSNSFYGIISFLLILMVFSSFVELIFLGGNNSKLQSMVIATALLLSWLGIRGIAGIAWIIILVFGIYNIITNNIVMGFFGFIYIAFGAIGVILHSGMNPGYLVQSLISEYTNNEETDSPSYLKEESTYGLDYLEEKRKNIARPRQRIS